MRRHAFTFKLAFDTNFVTRTSNWKGWSDEYFSLQYEPDFYASDKVKRDVANWLRLLIQECAAGRTMGRMSYECIGIGNTEDEYKELCYAIWAMNKNHDAGPEFL